MTTELQQSVASELDLTKRGRDLEDLRLAALPDSEMLSRIYQMRHLADLKLAVKHKKEKQPILRLRNWRSRFK